MKVTDVLKKVSELSSELRDGSRNIQTICEGQEETFQSGISLLQAKSATLMRYNLNLIRYTQARIRGVDVTSITEKLVQDWVALSKIKPLEKKLQYQIDNVLKASASRAKGLVDEEDRHRPNPSAFVFDEDEEEEEHNTTNGVYKPPRLAEVVYDPRDEKQRMKEMKEKQRARMRTIRSEGVREMLADIKGRPEEIRESDVNGVQNSKQLRRLMREDEERRRYEEENFTRLNVTRKDKKRKRDIARSMDGPMNGQSDEFSNLLAITDRVMDGKKKKVNNEKKDSFSAEQEQKMNQLDELANNLQRNGNKRKKISRKGKRR